MVRKIAKLCSCLVHSEARRSGSPSSSLLKQSSASTRPATATAAAIWDGVAYLTWHVHVRLSRYVSLSLYIPIETSRFIHSVRSRFVLSLPETPSLSLSCWMSLSCISTSVSILLYRSLSLSHSVSLFFLFLSCFLLYVFFFFSLSLSLDPSLSISWVVIVVSLSLSLSRHLWSLSMSLSALTFAFSPTLFFPRGPARTLTIRIWEEQVPLVPLQRLLCLFNCRSWPLSLNCTGSWASLRV